MKTLIMVVAQITSALLVFVGSEAAPAQGPKYHEPSVFEVLSADLDGDGSLERVEVVQGFKKNTYGGTAPIPVQYVRVVDVDRGRKTVVQISPTAEYISLRLVRDYAEDARPDVWFEGYVGAGTGAVFIGLVSWTGTGPKELWKYNVSKSDVEEASRSMNFGRRMGWSGAGAKLFKDPSIPGNGLKIVLREGVWDPNMGPRCCSGFVRVSIFRFDGARFVLYKRFWGPR